MPPLSTVRLRYGDLRVFFFSTATVESRVWVISGWIFAPPFGALGGMVVNDLVCGLGLDHVVVVVVIVNVGGDVVFGFYLVWKPIGEFLVMCIYIIYFGIGTSLSRIFCLDSVRRLSGT